MFRTLRAYIFLSLLAASAMADKDGYAGSTACAGCHAEIYRSFRRTAMGRSMAPAAGIAPGLEAGPVTVAHRKFDRTLRVWREGGAVYQAESQPGAFEIKHELVYVVGAGANGYSYVVERGDRLFQAPLSYYRRPRNWGLSPGYDSGDFAFSRPIAESCIVCHSGRARAIPDQAGRYQSPPFEELAIGCENCHGPGRAHVSGNGRGPIVNPAKLAPRLAEQICMYCHQGGDTRVLQPGKSYADFRPGAWLDETLAIANLPGAHSDGDLLEHHTAMAASRCFRASGGKLSCLTCHDPHVEPSAERRASYYRARCLTCHTSRSCTASARLRQSRADDCIACHMPQREDRMISHSALTNHRIIRTAGVTAQTAATPALENGIIHVNAVPNGKPLPPLTLLRIYGELMDREPHLADRYLALLGQLARTDLDDPLVLAAIGRKEVREKADEQAAGHLARAIERGFKGWTVFADLAEAQTRLGRNVEALSVLERGIKTDPLAPVLRKTLIMRLIDLHRYGEAKAAMQSYTEMFPEDSFMRALLDRVNSRQ